MEAKQPWETEPDSKQWTHLGLDCVIVRMKELGHLCGYVRVPEGHVLHGVDYSSESPALATALEELKQQPMPDNPSFGVMLGCLSGELNATPEIVLDVHGGITYAKDHQPKESSDGGWWFGFDCAHLGDLSPLMGFDMGGDVYRDMEYVTNEANRLADQLAALAKARNE